MTSTDRPHHRRLARAGGLLPPARQARGAPARPRAAGADRATARGAGAAGGAGAGRRCTSAHRARQSGKWAQYVANAARRTSGPRPSAAGRDAAGCWRRSRPPTATTSLVLQQQKLNLGTQINQATAARQVNRNYAAAAYGARGGGRMDLQRVAVALPVLGERSGEESSSNERRAAHHPYPEYRGERIDGANLATPTTPPTRPPDRGAGPDHHGLQRGDREAPAVARAAQRDRPLAAARNWARRTACSSGRTAWRRWARWPPGLAHEIRNPLGGIQLYASMLAQGRRRTARSR